MNTGKTGTYTRKYSREYNRKHKRKYLRGTAAGNSVLIICMIILSVCLLSGFASKPEVTQVVSGEKYYAAIVVNRGDSLWSIASRHLPANYGIKEYIREIRQINQMTDERIYCGQKLLIPCYEQESVPPLDT